MLRKKKHSEEVKENKKKLLSKVPFKLLAPEAQMCRWQVISITGIQTLIY